MSLRLQLSNIALCMGAIVVLLYATGLASAAEERKGTTAEELARLELPRPYEIEVALLPFWDSALDQGHVDDCRDSLIDLFAAECFGIAHPALVATIASQDQTLEPGMAMRRGDAVRLGKSLGVDWAVYGSITDMRVYRKTTLISHERKARASVQLNVVDVASGETIFWEQRIVVTGAAWDTAKATLEKKVLHMCCDRILQSLFGVMPEHPKIEPDPRLYAYLAGEEAKEAYDSALGDFDAALTYGQALLCASSGQDAVQVLAGLVAVHSTNADARFWHGVACYAIGKRDEAVSEWQAALLMDKDHALAARQLDIAGEPRLAAVAAEPAPPVPGVTEERDQAEDEDTATMPAGDTNTPAQGPLPPTTPFAIEMVNGTRVTGLLADGAFSFAMTGGLTGAMMLPTAQIVGVSRSDAGELVVTLQNGANLIGAFTGETMRLIVDGNAEPVEMRWAQVASVKPWVAEDTAGLVEEVVYEVAYGPIETTDGTLCLPLRDVVKMAGVDDASVRSSTYKGHSVCVFKHAGHAVKIRVGDSKVYVDNQPRNLSMAAYGVDRMYVPADFISVGLGYTVDVDTQANTITCKTEGRTVVVTSK